MPRSFNQKLKILYLMKAFEEKTDREHPISVAEIIKYMDSYGISVERKAVYDDIETLRVFGMKIENRRGRPSGYFLADRTSGIEDFDGRSAVIQIPDAETVPGTSTQTGKSDQCQ